MTPDLRKLYAISKLIGTGEAIAASGLLGEALEGQLRRHLVETCNAFGLPTIAERASPNFITINNHNPKQGAT